ncbi:NACHT domain-containing protein [Streptomyces sp. NPDC001177]
MAGLGGCRQRRNWQLIGALCALAIVVCSVYAVREIIHGGLQPADTAGLLGLPLGVAGLVAAVVALRKPVEGNDAELARGWAATLAGQVEAGESAVWRQLLGDDTRRIDLAYVLHPAAVRPAAAPAAGRLFADGPSLATLPDIVTCYRDTRPLRLVVTGAAGAGKTVLALELLLALIDGRAEDDPVPVRIPLSLWDTERQSLTELLQQRLVEAYDWPADLAAGLARHHLILPVLDGLDEMDPPALDGSPDPAAPRATAVIRALNAYQQGRYAGPLILTCRTRHYDALAPHTTVLDAARITVAPVDTDDARDYLTGRALDPARWQPLTDHLTAHPEGPLATVLSTPWRLCLTATAYHHHGDPAELLTLPDPDALDRHLLARYIPAATRTTPNPHGYTPQDVHRWLHHLTTHLDPTGTPQATATTGSETTDLVLHELWPLAGRTRVRTTDTLLTTLAVLTTLPLAWTTPKPVTGVLAAAICTLAVLTGTAAALTTTDSPHRLQNPVRNPQARRDLAASLAYGLALGLTLGLTAGLALGLGFTLLDGPAAGLTAGLALGLGLGHTLGFTLGLGLGLGLAREPDTSLGAQANIVSDALTRLRPGLGSGLAREPDTSLGAQANALIRLMVGVTAGGALGILGGEMAGITFGITFGITSGLPAGLTLGLTLGLTVGLAAGAQASRRYLVFLICSRRRLPFRLGLFLDWAVTAGLMRNSGSDYQYRHRELQHWLRQHPHPPPLP